MKFTPPRFSRPASDNVPPFAATVKLRPFSKFSVPFVVMLESVLSSVTCVDPLNA